jgi:hypothetical protein
MTKKPQQYCPIWHYFSKAQSTNTHERPDGQIKTGSISQTVQDSSPSKSIVSVHTLPDLPIPPPILLCNLAYPPDPSTCPIWQPIKILPMLVAPLIPLTPTAERVT